MTLATKVSTESFEIVSFAYKTDVPFDTQFSSTQALNEIVNKLKGFKSRAFYFSEDYQRWFDFIVWESQQDAQNASKQIMKTPEALEIFALMDDTTLSFAHYQKLGAITAESR